MKVTLSVDHAGKPSHPNDRGAVWPGPPVIEEVDLTRRYTAAADRELRRLGHVCVIMSDDVYANRWARTDAYKMDIYVACHINAGGGDRGEVYHDRRSKRGAALAATVASILGRMVPWPCKAVSCGPGDRAFNCISGVRAVALCYEPGFLDCPVEPHRRTLFDDPEGIGVALARGIDAWGRAG